MKQLCIGTIYSELGYVDKCVWAYTPAWFTDKPLFETQFEEVPDDTYKYILDDTTFYGVFGKENTTSEYEIGNVLLCAKTKAKADSYEKRCSPLMTNEAEAYSCMMRLVSQGSTKRFRVVPIFHCNMDKIETPTIDPKIQHELDVIKKSAEQIGASINPIYTKFRANVILASVKKLEGLITKK